MRFLLIGGRSTTIVGSSAIYPFISNNCSNILYIPFAKSDYLKSFNNFKDLVNVNVDCLEEKDLLNIDIIKDKISKADGYYFQGGDFERLYMFYEKYNLDKYFNEEINKNKLFIGLSAGAILFSKYGMGDKYSYLDNGKYYNFKMVKGIGYLPITFCPHYQKNELVIFDDEVKNYQYDAYALEDDTAIFFNDNNYLVLKDDKTRSVYRLKKDDNYCLESIY